MLTIAVLICGASHAASGDLASCRSIADDKARLLCFDELDRAPAVAAPAIPLQPAPTVTVPAQTGSVPAAAAAPAAPPIDNFGAVAIPKKAPDEPKEVTAKLIGAIDGVRRGLIFPLDNGQTWTVIDDREFEYIGKNPAVKLDRNLIGSYWMRILDGGPRFKVRRVK